MDKKSKDALAATQAALGDFTAAQETQRLALRRSQPEVRVVREQRLARYEQELTLRD